MDAGGPARCWYQKRRCWAALALWLVALPVLYTLSVGPAFYAYERGWIGERVMTAFGIPFAAVYRRLPPSRRTWLDSYGRWWIDLGRGDAASD